jgi:purine nucleosidase
VDEPGPADDLLNFQYDPVACAVAVGWPGAVVEQARLQLVHEGELVRFRPGAAGRPMRMLAGLDSGGFTDYWLKAVEAAQALP